MFYVLHIVELNIVSLLCFLFEYCGGVVMRDVEIPKWLKGLPLAPEFRPTDTEFADPIAYISKIEKEASAFGICKVIPPLPKPSKKYVLHNLNKSLSKCPELGSDVNVCSTVNTMDNVGEGSDSGGEFRAVFTTRHQELGTSGKRMKGVGENKMSGPHKQVWQSGEVYTFEQFEAKAKSFARSQLSLVNDVCPLVIEAMFWKAASEKPIYVEYANDVPGSGFGEPEGLFRYFRRRRRRRKRGTFDRNSKVSSSNKDSQVDTVNKIGMGSDSCSNNDSNICKETTKDSSSLPSTSSDQSALSNRRKSSNACPDMEGTAGWKLSNCPWNLQVIARSPGSLTRFMPDDIPGVTSPMVYIGMLFSWFAWHVEDHELHSLNFLHMGSPKTWYAVPGEYACSFEEVIRHHAYGGNTDSLAALTLLGEKTTLLSPEVVVASGIPCCRLVQNPGEFVVTFPRAYHVGFSHGFNCGEAANFGTPQWLAVANEAAVRRAAMNYLPMLSHQQLLYLLTMSFISRVPRSLLLGVRSSRRRDRQKEERERLVKKAFVEDIIKENKLLTILLQKNSSYRVVEWDLESLPSSIKGAELCNNIETVATTTIENDSVEANRRDLCTEMSLYMEAVDDFYEEDDDLSDFRVDSGTLPCVACGILGFPFMAVLQPSEKVLRDLLLEDHVDNRNLGAPQHVESHDTFDFNSIVNASDPDKLNPVAKNILHDPDETSSFAQSSQSTFSVPQDQLQALDHSSSLKCEAASAEVQLQKGLNDSNRFSRPRIFCLEHATQTEELLCSRGGANIVVICHSDFRRIRAHVPVVAEEIGIPFSYQEIPFDKASQEDLNLIDIATDNEEQEECAEDWTSRLNINLQQCMKLRKKFPSSKVQHALGLGELFSVTNQNCNAVGLIWQSRKSRSRRCSNHPVQNKPSMNIEMEKHEDLMENSDIPVASEEERIQLDKSDNGKTKPEGRMPGQVNMIIQYSRRKYRCKPFVSPGVGQASAGPNFLLPEELSGAAGCRHPDAETSTMYESSPSLVASSREGALQLDSQILIPNNNNNNNENCLESREADSIVATAPSIRSIEAENGNSEMKELTTDNVLSNLTSQFLQMPQEIKAVEENNEKNWRSISENSSGSAEAPKQTSENCETAAMNPIENETKITNSTSPLVADDLDILSNKHVNRDVLVNEASNASSSNISSIDSPPVGIIDEQMGKTEETHLDLDRELIDHLTFNNKRRKEVQTTEGDNQNKAVSSRAALTNASASALVEDIEVPKETDASEDSHSEDGTCSVEKMEMDDSASTIQYVSTSAKFGRKRKRELDLLAEGQISSNGFVRSPCESLRPRSRKGTVTDETDCKRPVETQKVRKQADDSVPHKDTNQQKKGSDRCKDAKQHKIGPHRCDIESCRMSFHTKAELLLHKRNRCTYTGCGKTFSAHKYVLLHQRVHDDDRPLKCTWKGCTMSFKWAWARTEHLRVHTGERPYKCKVDGCGRTFRFVSDYSRHRRKTGHYVD